MNAFSNNTTNPPDQSTIYATLLGPYLTYAICGAVGSVLNIVCILTFITNKEFRKKYIFFTVLSFGNLINTIYAFVFGTLRRKKIYSNQLLPLDSVFECLLQPTPHLNLLGLQLPTVVLLVIDIERFIAVYKPIFYRVHFTDRTRIFTIFGSFGVVIVSLLVGYLISYLRRNIGDSGFCTIPSVFGQNYSNYNFAVVTIFPIFAFILNIITYIGAKRLREHANKKKELRLILITLIITFVDVLLITCPNIALFGYYNKLWTMSANISSFSYLFFCCSSAINLFVYICLKEDFRNHFLMCISFGTFRSYLEMSSGTERSGFSRSRQVWPTIGSGRVIRVMSQMPVTTE